MEQLYTFRTQAKEILGDKHEIRIDNVDNFQGEESDIIILSPVRSFDATKKIGFLNVRFKVFIEEVDRRPSTGKSAEQLGSRSGKRVIPYFTGRP